MLTFRQDSRLLAATLHIVDGTREWGLRTALELLDGDEFIIHKCNDGDTLPKLSMLYYNTEYMWWVLADVNDMLEPWTLVLDQTVKVPKKATIMALWERQRCAS